MHTAPPAFPRGDGSPWYRHRWPWFLMIGPVLVLVAAAVTTWLALSRPDAMVVDDYYRQGKAINQDLRRDRVASRLGLSFAARHDPRTGRLTGHLQTFGAPVVAPFHIRWPIRPSPKRTWRWKRCRTPKAASRPRSRCSSRPIGRSSWKAPPATGAWPTAGAPPGSPRSTSRPTSANPKNGVRVELFIHILTIHDNSTLTPVTPRTIAQ